MDPKDTDLEPLTETTIVDHLRAAGITRPFLRRMTEPGDDLRSPLTPTREALYTDDPAALLMRLFFCREAVDSAELPPAVRACELLEAGPDGRVSSPLHLRLVGDLFLFSDYLGVTTHDAVMGAGETTAILYRAGRPRHRLTSALDLGCGAGTLALLLARNVDRVVGTDINPRAVEIGRLNARVNHIDNCEFRAGDVWDPVAHEQFDLILSQPPYYPLGTAGDDLTYLHGGIRGDELPTRVVQGVPEHLSPGGRALIFTSWPEGSDPQSLAGCSLLELFTNRRELHGTRQALDVIEHGDAWSERFEVSAECWGEIDPERIDERLEAIRLLRDPERLAAAKLRVPDGIEVLSEGEQIVLRYPPEALVGWVNVEESMWRTIQAVRGGASVAEAGVEQALTALKRGLLSAC